MVTPAAPAISEPGLRECLEQAGLDIEPEQLHWQHVGRFSNDIWRADLSSGPVLIAKQPYRRTQADAERAFYRAIAQIAKPQMAALPIPRYLGEVEGVLLLEFQTLSEFSFQTGVTETHADAAIDALADWHAAWWQRAPDANWLPRMDDPLVLMDIQNRFDDAWREHRDRLSASAPEFQPIGDALIGRLATTLRTDSPTTLIHGDAHAENLPLTASGRVLMLDWQEPKVANPGYDLAVFTSMSFRQSDRGNHERNLLQRYVQRLTGAGHVWPEPWRDYRLGLLRRAARIVEIANQDFPSLPWVFRRSAMAAVEVEAVELIR